MLEKDKDGRFCLQKLGYSTVDELRRAIRNMRRTARVSTPKFQIFFHHFKFRIKVVMT